MFHGVGSSLVVQSPRVKSPASGVLAHPLTATSRLHRSHSAEDKHHGLMAKKLLIGKKSKEFHILILEKEEGVRRKRGKKDKQRVLK